MSQYKGTLIFIWILLLSSGLSLQAQEKLTPLWFNPVLKYSKAPKILNSTKPVLALPFIEDFSGGEWYPNLQHWSDRMAYVNFHYSVRPPTVGVATLDALDALGALYATASAFPFPADTLTSQPIDLSAYKQSDSLYFSFHYQPEGLGNAPERDDSLLVEFWSQPLQSWVHVWADRGRTLSSFTATYGQPWHVTIIPVDSSLFFSGNFRFRFRNFASITDVSLPDWGGNVDMWHLDYILLNSSRTFSDTLIRNDLAFRDYPESMLKNYFSMPWNQYLANPQGEMIPNPDSIRIPYTAYYYNTTNPVLQSFTVNSLTGGTSYAPPAYSFGNLNMPVDTFVKPNPNVSLSAFTFAAPSAPYADFEIMAAVSPFSISEVIRTNDTVRFYQKFYNYYAYDDGTAEAGYGLSSSNPNAKLMAAVRYRLNIPDTLRSVQIFFNQVKDHANEEYFTLTIWDNQNGMPGDTLYTEENLLPLFGEGINYYQNYNLSHPIAVSDTIWVGWQQKTGTMLNLGYDRNRNAKENLFYNVGSGWSQSQYNGALMIRPVLGDTTEPWLQVPDQPRKVTWRLYPNPASTLLHIEPSEPFEGSIRLEFRNQLGQLVKVAETEGTTDLDGLTAGLYFVQIIPSGKETLSSTYKLIITGSSDGRQ
jgi:hypothetical protein